ncbi:MAG: hypothetical protein HQK73_00150 [Desulfamplus sp.]|nr:hypothetical protein [Desulfamplus sp.]MBF0411136.1 hypothetical protein [Desulfamplus sp.]
MKPYEEIDFNKIHTYNASQRSSKVLTTLEAKPFFKGMSMSEFLNSLPSMLKANDLKTVALAIVKAKEKKKPVIVMLGGHVIKTGCSPILTDLAKKGFITHFASNGSAAIHDTELARVGHTSEDVASQLTDGSFGMASDTAALVNGAAKRASKLKRGFGQTVGAMLIEENAPFNNRALLANAFLLEIPYTLHIAIGTDIVHQHPDADGASIGDASLRDFRIFVASVAKLGNGGVVLNLGSAVIMPEVFLKAISVARNLGYEVTNFATANFDMIQHYRPVTNVVNRPVLQGGQGFSITGHHEIMIPLLAAAVYELAKV